MNLLTPLPTNWRNQQHLSNEERKSSRFVNGSVVEFDSKIILMSLLIASLVLFHNQADYMNEINENLMKD